MVVGEVGEDARTETEPGDAVLLDADGTHLHEAVAAARVDHLREKAVDGDRVGGRVHGLAPPRADIVGDGRQQAAVVAEAAEEVIEQGDRRGLAVGAGDADELEFPGRVAVEIVGGEGEGLATVGGDSKDDAFGNALRLILAENGGGALFDGASDEAVAVRGGALHGNEKAAGRDAAGVTGDAGDVHAGIPPDGADAASFQYLGQFHSSVNSTVLPSDRRAPASGRIFFTWPMPR